MRMIKKITLALILFAFSFGIYACQEKSKNYSLNLSADKESAFPGEVVQFSTELVGDQIDVEIIYEIKSGAEYATINNEGLLTIKEDAPAGKEISVVSKTEDKISNSVKVKTLNKILKTTNIFFIFYPPI